MEAPSHNHVNYLARLDYIQRLLGDNFGLSDKVSAPFRRCARAAGVASPRVCTTPRP